MRTVVIETKNAPKDLIRFTEVRCLFDYKNNWTGFFGNIVFEENADDYSHDAWRIRAGQYITSTIREQNKQLVEVDLRQSSDTIDYDNDFSFTRRMPQYKGKKQEYMFENYMRMVLKAKKRMLYLSNNDSPPKLPSDFKDDVWLPASGTRAYETWASNPKIKPIIYDINNDQLEFAKWLNQQPEYPTEEAMTDWIDSKFHRSAIAEAWQPLPTPGQWSQWATIDKQYVLRDILELHLPKTVFLSNITQYLPCYHKWGFRHIQSWINHNSHMILSQ